MSVILMFAGMMAMLLLFVLCAATGWSWAKIGSLEQQVRALQREVDELRGRPRRGEPPGPASTDYRVQ